MAKAENKLHAIHNENASIYLDIKAEYPDWVITTSFYSSLHYLQSIIFPIKVSITKTESTKFETLEEFHKFRMWKGDKKGMHDRFKDLVEQRCPDDVAGAYGELLELSFTARYAKYEYPPEIVSEAKKKLQFIKRFCCPPKKS